MESSSEDQRELWAAGKVYLQLSRIFLRSTDMQFGLTNEQYTQYAIEIKVPSGHPESNYTP